MNKCLHDSSLAKNLHHQKCPTVTAETHHPLPHCAHIHCSVSITFIKCWWMSMGAIFSIWRNSVTHLSFIHASMSDAIVSDCPSAAISHMATTWNGILGGRFPSTSIPPTSASDVMGQYSKIVGITFGAALVYKVICFLFPIVYFSLRFFWLFPDLISSQR